MSTGSAGVLLIDIENMIGTLAKPGNLILRLDAIIQQAGPGMVIVAACAEANITPQGILIFKERDVELLQVGASKDAADQALLERARSFASHGHTRFMVASGDGTFGGIADLGDLEIVLWKTQQARKKGYVDRARRTHRIPRPKPATAAKVTTVLPRVEAPKPVDAQPKTPTETEPQPENLVVPTVDEPSASENVVLLTIPKWAAEVGIGLLGAGAIFAAGVVFGAGTAVGAEAARRVLRQLP